jgi:hypothetical protein
LIIPVLWVPVDDRLRALPRRINEIQYTHADLGKRYNDEGLRFLLSTGKESAYQNFLSKFSRMVLDAIRRHPLEQKLPTKKLEDFPNAFAEHHEDDPLQSMPQDKSLVDGTAKEATRYGVIANPFQKAGTMPSWRASYVERDCDQALSSALQEYPLIAVYGDYRIGKSSLLERTINRQNNSVKCIQIDLTGARTDNSRLLHDRFFEKLEPILGTVRDWDGFSSALTTPTALFIDEFGRLGADTAPQFVSGLHYLATAQPHIRIVVVVKDPIDIFLPRVGVQNPKYSQNWHSIPVPPFNDKEMDSLLRLLPPASLAMAIKNLSAVVSNSAREPRPLQCLCYDLFTAELEGQPESTLESIIQDKKTYNR